MSTKRVFQKQNPHTVEQMFERKDWNFVGVADAHGIESFIHRNDCEMKDVAMLSMRVASNRQRHAVVYFTDVDKATEQKVQQAMDSGDWEQALKVIKTDSDNVLMTNANSWQLIPNPQLDPWAHG